MKTLPAIAAIIYLAHTTAFAALTVTESVICTNTTQAQFTFSITGTNGLTNAVALVGTLGQSDQGTNSGTNAWPTLVIAPGVYTNGSVAISSLATNYSPCAQFIYLSPTSPGTPNGSVFEPFTNLTNAMLAAQALNPTQVNPVYILAGGSFLQGAITLSNQYIHLIGAPHATFGLTGTVKRTTGNFNIENINFLATNGFTAALYTETTHFTNSLVTGCTFTTPNGIAISNLFNGLQNFSMSASTGILLASGARIDVGDIVPSSGGLGAVLTDDQTEWGTTFRNVNIHSDGTGIIGIKGVIGAGSRPNIVEGCRIRLEVADGSTRNVGVTGGGIRVFGGHIASYTCVSNVSEFCQVGGYLESDNGPVVVGLAADSFIQGAYIVCEGGGLAGINGFFKDCLFEIGTYFNVSVITNVAQMINCHFTDGTPIGATYVTQFNFVKQPNAFVASGFGDENANGLWRARFDGAYVNFGSSAVLTSNGLGNVWYISLPGVGELDYSNHSAQIVGTIWASIDINDNGYGGGTAPGGTFIALPINTNLAINATDIILSNNVYDGGSYTPGNLLMNSNRVNSMIRTARVDVLTFNTGTQTAPFLGNSTGTNLYLNPIPGLANTSYPPTNSATGLTINNTVTPTNTFGFTITVSASVASIQSLEGSGSLETNNVNSNAVVVLTWSQDLTQTNIGMPAYYRSSLPRRDTQLFWTTSGFLSVDVPPNWVYGFSNLCDSGGQPYSSTYYNGALGVESMPTHFDTNTGGLSPGAFQIRRKQ